MKKDYSILIGGAAGQGSRMAGLIIAKIFNSMGYSVFIHEDYQSLVKGGHNFSLIRASEKEYTSHNNEVDFVLALNNETIFKHEKCLKKDGFIIFNKKNIEVKKGIGIEIDKIVKELDGISIMGNIAMISGFAKIVGIEWKTIEKIFKKEISKKIDKNLEIAKRAYNEVDKIIEIEKLKRKEGTLLTGNEAICLGAVDAGLDVYSAYPMTPATSILHYLAENSKKFKVIVSQSENEIAAINSIIGSAYAGKRAMTGTSGGGFALMTEGISLSAQSEVPALVVNSQRSGPATGVPTYGGQSDLLFALASGHGDFVRFVASPGDANEAYFLSGTLLNLAWKYQTPAILLTDKELSESTYEFNPEIKIKKEKPLLWNDKGEYKRYVQSKNGISPLAFPGGKGIVKSTSYEHDEKGLSVEDSESIVLMQDKRLRKFKEMEKEIDNIEAVKVYGKKNSTKAVIFWGSTKGAIKEAVEKIDIKAVQVLFLQPLPKKQIKKALKGAKKIILVECSATGQLEKVLKECEVKVDKKILKYDMRPFTAKELELKLKNI
jgi:2-oxoglutarate ferredoxin oxidoreductase subunit alpha